MTIVRMLAKEHGGYLGISVGKKLNMKGVSHTNDPSYDRRDFIHLSSTG